MIVRTWCGSRVELNRYRVLPWLLGWWRVLVRPSQWRGALDLWRRG